MNLKFLNEFRSILPGEYAFIEYEMFPHSIKITFKWTMNRAPHSFSHEMATSKPINAHVGANVNRHWDALHEMLLKRVRWKIEKAGYMPRP